MTIQLPTDVERDIIAEVRSGHFASVDEALAEAWRSFQQRRQLTAPIQGAGLIGALRDDAELLDQAVEHARTVRQERPAVSQPEAVQANKPIWEEILEMTADVPDEEWDKLPTDLAEQHDHYIYGTPKRPTA
jgi:Arc/MetJ-type ribon-helix-helix transcriptional regulator